MTVNPSWRNIQPAFRLNGVYYEFDELSEIGYSLVKEGEPYEKSIGNFLLDWVNDKPSVEVFTSGSTGKPKKITLKKKHMVNSAIATGKHFNLYAGNTALLCLSCSGIAGKMMLVRAMVLGLALDYVAPSSTPLVNSKKTYDFVAMVPLQVENTLAQLPQTGILIIGGAPVTKSLKEKLEQVSSRVFETYGMTETITHIAVKRIHKNSVNSSAVETYFTTLPDITVSTDHRDCLVISAPYVSDNSVVTNDIVELVDGTGFKWLGRYDSIVNSGGIKLVPEQIEAKLSSIILSRFFVTGIPDQTLGQKLVLLVEDELVSKTELLQKIKTLKEINKYEIPKEIHLVKPFIETESGKIDREKTLLQIG